MKREGARWVEEGEYVEKREINKGTQVIFFLFSGDCKRTSSVGTRTERSGRSYIGN